MNKKKFRGQNLYLFLGLLPAMMIMLGAVIDFGRFMLLHAQAAALADSTALAASNAIDMNLSVPGGWLLDKGAARNLADSIFMEWNANRLEYETWMQIRMESITIVGNRVRVVVVGECDPWFLGAIGVDTFSVRVESYARAAVGVEEEE
jgi:hypothetical protein